MNDAPNARDLNLSHVGKRTAYKLGFRAGLAMADPLADERVCKLVEALRNVIDEYDRFRKDEYERGLSPLDDEIHDARAALAAIEAQP